ncbi:MAG TPA: hypothetical protein ENK08_08725 [Chloroflexi bacterium]|nr:hypothetical protein [Chloroflexota bacterium]
MGGQENPAGMSVERWEQKLIEDYRDYRWRRLMEPLCEKMERWRVGKLPYAEMDETMEELYREVCELRNLFSQREDRVVLLIQWLDREWFEEWVKEHRPPPGARLVEPVK